MRIRNKQFKNAVDKLVSGKTKAGHDRQEWQRTAEEKKVNEISRRRKACGLLRLIKDFDMTLTGLRGLQRGDHYKRRSKRKRDPSGNNGVKVC